MLLEDKVLPFRLENSEVRGRLVRLGPTINTILENHKYPEDVSEMLAEAVVLTANLAAGLKYDGVFSLQTVGDGPIKALVADITSDGGMRGYAGFDMDRLIEAREKTGERIPRLLGAGHLAFTVDQGRYTQPYQGVTPLEGASLAECAHAYFRNSEQLETVVKVASGKSGAAALLLQRMPGEGGSDLDFEDEELEEGWREAVVLMSSVTEEELLDPELPMQDLLFRLFHEQGVRVFDTKSIHQECRCSEERLRVTLKSMPLPELNDMIEEGGTTVTCHFCSKDYTFDKGALADLRDEKVRDKEEQAKI